MDLMMVFLDLGSPNENKEAHPTAVKDNSSNLPGHIVFPNHRTNLVGLCSFTWVPWNCIFEFIRMSREDHLLLQFIAKTATSKQ